MDLIILSKGRNRWWEWPGDNDYQTENGVPLGRFWGCRNVKELVPNVRLARFHKESLPSLFSLPGGGEPAASSGGGACDISATTYSDLQLLFLNNRLL